MMNVSDNDISQVITRLSLLRGENLKPTSSIWETAGEIHRISNGIIRILVPEIAHLSDAQIRQMLDDYEQR